MTNLFRLALSKPIPLKTAKRPSLRMRSSSVLMASGMALLMSACVTSPSDVCEKMFNLATAGVGEALAKEAIGGDLAKCTEREARRKEHQGIFKYNENNKCLMSAQTWKDALACAK